MVVNGKGTSNDEPLFTIEDNILKGRVVKIDSKYTSIGKLLFDSLRNKPDFIGQVDTITGNEDTFGEIADRAVKCALWLQKYGVGKGDVVAISTHNHLDAVVPYFATFFLGAIANPWDYEMNIQLARHFIKLTQPKVIFANEKSVSVIMEASKIEVFHTKVVSFSGFPGTIPFSDVLKDHTESAVVNFECKQIEDHLTALILFSSGTTDLPKGTQLSNRALLNVMELNENFALSTTTPMWFSSLYWVSGSLLSLKSITSYSKKIIAPDFDEKTACELIEKFQVSWLMLSTSMSNRLVRYNHLHEYNLSSLKTLLTGGAILTKESEELMRKNLPNTRIIQAYGMTELCGLVLIQLPDTVSGSCGVISTNCQAKIVDPGTGNVLGPNQPGELCVKSWSMMTGYYRNPEATKATIDKEGWMHTGDLAYYNEKGEFFIIDRLKELIKYQGHQMTPVEIETVLHSHPAVLEVAVVGIPHPTDDEHPVAFVSKVPNKEVSAEELIKIVEMNLMDHHKLRGGVKFLPTLPHTHSGKIARKELRAVAKTLADF
ncbi:4-coumarate--CoA ligase 1-like [Ceratina calcarata]|uniref:4-coumarate--CoA ligase 1-like n=1 Tax=Ceratina calcarata TaxID=156304 RepID=A0AAJ7JHR7_9HYME|nr:4-coumarate--CoA ligase 1-like [Ceratina calcarata]